MNRHGKNLMLAASRRAVAFCVIGCLAGRAFWPIAALAQDATAAAADQTADDQETRRNELWAAAQQAYEKQEYAQAISLGEQTLAVELTWLGPDHGDVIISIEWLADVHASAAEWPKATQRRREALAWRQRNQGDDHWQTTTARLTLEAAVLAETLPFATRLMVGEAFALRVQASTEYSEGRVSDACKSAESSLARFEQALGADHLQCAIGRQTLGELQQELGQYDNAVETVRRALEILEPHIGRGHPDFATTENLLGIVYLDMAKYAEAEAVFRHVIEVRGATLGFDHDDYAVGLHNLGLALMARTEYAEAEQLLTQAGDIWKASAGEDSSDYADCLGSLGLIAMDLGNLTRAEERYRQSLAIYERISGEQSLDAARTHYNLGQTYFQAGDYKQCASEHRTALAMWEALVGKQHALYASGLSGVGTALIMQGEFAAAEPLLREGIAIREATIGKDHDDYATGLTELAELYRLTGDYERAEPLYAQAAEIMRKAVGDRHPTYGAVLTGQAAMYNDAEQFARAEPILQQILTIDRDVFGPRHSSVAIDLFNLAVVYGNLKRFDEAESSMEQALDVYRETVGEAHPYYAMALARQAEIFYYAGKHDRIEPLVRQALETRRIALGARHPEYAESVEYLAQWHDIEGRHDLAEPLHHEALEIVTQLAEETAAVQDEQGQLRHARRLRDFLDGYLNSLVASNANPAAAFEATLNWKGDTLVRQRASRAAAEDAELRPLLDELQTVVREWSTRASLAAQGKGSLDELQQLAARKERLEAELTRRSADYRAATVRVEAADVIEALPANGALVDFFEFRAWDADNWQAGPEGETRHLLAFVARPNQPVQMFSLGPVEPIAAAVDAWRRGYGATEDAAAAGRLLREKLWVPLAGALGDAQVILVSPDGALGKLPFAALPGKAPETYLIDEVAIAVVPVPQLIPALMRGETPRELPTELLAIGGVDYDRRSAVAAESAVSAAPLRPWERRGGDPLLQRSIVGAQRWEYLPGTDGEAAYIKELYLEEMNLPATGTKVVLLRGAAATEESVRKLAPQSYLLHISTHGFFAEEDRQSALQGDDAPTAVARGGAAVAAVRGFSPGLLSGLVFAGANEPVTVSDDADRATLPDDGILTADEIASLPLGGAQLVVLSACETGLGESAGGEGLLGIQRAFQVAGARATIATLWKINDEATRAIMEEFYRNYLERQLPPLEALREAQRWALKHPELANRGVAPPDDAEGPPKRLPPQFWAAFTLSGDWR